MNWRRLFSPCVFGHAADPLTVVRGNKMHQECRRCQQVLRKVLPKLKKRYPVPSRAKVLAMKRKAG